MEPQNARIGGNSLDPRPAADSRGTVDSLGWRVAIGIVVLTGCVQHIRVDPRAPTILLEPRIPLRVALILPKGLGELRCRPGYSIHEDLFTSPSFDCGRAFSDATEATARELFESVQRLQAPGDPSDADRMLWIDLRDLSVAPATWSSEERIHVAFAYRVTDREARVRLSSAQEGTSQVAASDRRIGAPAEALSETISELLMRMSEEIVEAHQHGTL